MMIPSSRLLPATIVLVAAVLAFKAVVVVEDAPGLEALRIEAGRAVTLAAGMTGVIGQAQAATAPTPQAAAPSPPAPVEAPAKASPAPAPRAAVEQPAPPAAPPADPLQARRSEIEERGRVLAQREITLAVADKRLAERVAELVALQSRLQALEAGRKQQDEANWAGLVKLYEGMRPREAAAIFNALDKPVLLEILDRMKPAKASPVLAAMEAEKARQLTADLADKRTRTTSTN